MSASVLYVLCVLVSEIHSLLFALPGVVLVISNCADLVGYLVRESVDGFE